MKFLLYCLIILQLSACAGEMNEQAANLIENRKLWESQMQSQIYTFEYTEQCACPLDGETIYIESDRYKVINATVVDGEALEVSEVKTIRQYFKFLQELVQIQQSDPNVTLTVKYDPKFGFPTEINYEESGSPDGSFTLSISKLRIIRANQ